MKDNLNIMNFIEHQDTTNLSQQFSAELTDPSFDLAQDYAEIFIDDLIENEILKEIPFVKTVVGVIKTGISINQLWFTKKLLTFIKEFNSRHIDPIKLSKFKTKINQDKKYRQKVVEQIMIFNDRFLEINKSKISAQLLIAYVEEKLTLEEFINLNFNLDKVHPSSYKFLYELEANNFELPRAENGNKNLTEQALLLSTGLAKETSAYAHGFTVNDEGIKLYEFGIKPLLNKDNRN